jgi:UDP-2,3-diacylglucosamine hydrolase
MANITHTPSVGLLAAWGRFPVQVAEAMKASGFRVCCLGVRDLADPALKSIADEFSWMNAARLGYAMRFFHKHGVTQATMAGKFHKVDLYKPWLLGRYIPDFTFLRTFYHHFVTGSADRKDDTLLGALAQAFDDRGVKMLPATDFAPQLLVPAGVLAGKPLTPSEQSDVEFGWQLAKEMGRLDVGQSVEAIEGTDLCIRRAGELCRKGGFTVVKVAKPQQDMRFDVPTIGPGTLETMRAAGAKVLAVEAGMTILLDEADFRATARRLGISVVAVAGSRVAQAA